MDVTAMPRCVYFSFFNDLVLVIIDFFFYTV